MEDFSWKDRFPLSFTLEGISRIYTARLIQEGDELSEYCDDVMVVWDEGSISYTHNEVLNKLGEGIWELLEDTDSVIEKEQINKPIKSTGGSSTYYDIPLSDKIVEAILARKEEGTTFIKTEELIEMLGSDFDLGNILKCNVRINSLVNGCGKEGNDVEYDANKIKYSANRLIERFSK